MTAISHHHTARDSLWFEIHGCANFASFLSAPINPLSGCKSTAEPHLIRPCLDSSAHLVGNLWQKQPWFCPVSPHQPTTREILVGNPGKKQPWFCPVSLHPPTTRDILVGNPWLNQPDSALSGLISPIPGNSGWKSMAETTLILPC